MSYIFHHTDLLKETPNITEALEEIQTWIDALRSGEYKQDIGQLQTSKGFCCLGVACKVLIPEDKQVHSKLFEGQLTGGDTASQPARPQWLRTLSYNVHNYFGASLINLNDSHKFTFDEIADILEVIFFERAFDGLELPHMYTTYKPEWDENNE